MRKEREISQATISQNIEPGMSLYDYIGNKGADQLYEHEKAVKTQFNTKIREIQKITCPHCVADFQGYILDPGEALMLINRNFKYAWDTIPYGEMDIIKTWLQDNHHRKLQLLNKDLHYLIMEMTHNSDAQEYINWFNKHTQG